MVRCSLTPVKLSIYYLCCAKDLFYCCVLVAGISKVGCHCDLNAPRGIGSADSTLGALVDLGSGLGHLPRRVKRQLIQRSRAHPSLSSPLLIAVEADPVLHFKAIELADNEKGQKGATQDVTLTRVLARVQKEKLQEFQDRCVETA